MCGSLNKKRCFGEFIDCVENLLDKFIVIVAGKSEKNSYLKNEKYERLVLIDRYIEDDEMMFLLSETDIVYAYYSPEVERPSGFFGRAMQLKKHVLIKKGGFLDKRFGWYEKALKVDSIRELLGIIPASGALLPGQNLPSGESGMAGEGAKLLRLLLPS